MAKILLIGRGPLPTPTAPQLGFSQLRTAAFADALASGGHAVRILSLESHPRDARTPLTQWEGVLATKEEGPGWIQRAREAADGADIVVSAGPYNPGRLAVAIADHRPVWVDVPGDPTAELAALARVTPDGLTDEQVAAALAGAAAVLSRADGISVISEAQRHATLGQLGLIGRLLSEDTSPVLATMPNSGDFIELKNRPEREDGLVVALAGSFNPWMDVDGLITCLETLFHLKVDARVICTGGGIEGFYEAGFEKFSTWASTQGDRVNVHGWLPHGDMLQCLASAHVGLSMDASGPEPELGSRTRLLLYAGLGLIPASTTRCELARDWAREGALVPLPFGDPVGAGEVLAGLSPDATIADRAAALTPTSAQVCVPLLQWCQQPRRCADFRSESAVLASELETTKDQLRAVYSSPSWRAMNRLHGLGLTAVGRLKSQ